MANLSWGRYNVAVPDLSDVGDNIQETAMQIKQYQDQKAQRERQRKDMMWQQYLSRTNLNVPEFNNKQLQQIKAGVTEGARQKFKEIAQETEGEFEWEDIQRTQRIQNAAQSTLNQLDQSYQTYMEEYKMAEEDPDKFKQESIDRVLEWDFKKNPVYEPQLEFEEKRLSDVVQEEASNFNAGGLDTISYKYEADGSVITDETELAREFWDFTEEGGERIVKPKQRKQMDVLRRHVIDKHTSAVISEWQNLSDRKKDDYKAMAEGIDGAKTGQEAMVYDMHQKDFFNYDVDRGYDFTRDEDETGGDVTTLDYLEDAKDFTDLPREITGEVKQRGLAKDVMERSGVKKKKKEAARLYEIPDETMIFDRNILNDGFIKTKKGKWEKFDKPSEYFEDARLKGIVVKNGKEYARLGAQVGDREKKRDGKTVYMRKELGMRQGTIPELAKQTDYNAKQLRNLIKQGEYVPVSATTQLAEVLVPVDENPEIKKFYNLQNKPEGTQKTQTQETEGSKTFGW